MRPGLIEGAVLVRMHFDQAFAGVRGRAAVREFDLGDEWAE
jgi:hypothetical protein